MHWMWHESSPRVFRWFAFLFFFSFFYLISHHLLSQVFLFSQHTCKCITTLVCWCVTLFSFLLHLLTTTTTEKHFSSPTWCQHCKGYIVYIFFFYTFFSSIHNLFSISFVKSPIGKQGYECSVCSFKIHADCKQHVTSLCWIEANAIDP